MMKNVKIGLVALVAVAFLASSASAVTWTVWGGIGYTQYNGSWYGLTDLGTWDQAQAQAVGAGGNLVTIDDAAENQFLLDTLMTNAAMDWLGDADAPVQQLWIGYNDVAVEGTWVWAGADKAEREALERKPPRALCQNGAAWVSGDAPPVTLAGPLRGLDPGGFAP